MQNWRNEIEAELDAAAATATESIGTPLGKDPSHLVGETVEVRWIEYRDGMPAACGKRRVKVAELDPFKYGRTGSVMVYLHLASADPRLALLYYNFSEHHWFSVKSECAFEIDVKLVRY